MSAELYPIGFREWLAQATPAEIKAAIAAESAAVARIDSQKPLHAMNEKELAEYVLRLPPDNPHFRQHSVWAKSVK